MNERKKTMMFAGAAVLLALIAFVTAPGEVTPDAFLDQGEQFFPDFTDPNEAKTLEVIEYDSDTGSQKPFKVTFSKGLWTIPSHHNHPADAKDRLSKTAAGVIGIKKDDFRTDNTSDHEFCEVIDPLDDTVTSLKGRGQRITLKNENDKILADFIVGKKVENREGFRFVRVPDQKRVYAVRMNIDISTNFTDWIESDLLLVDKDKVNNIVIRDYSINEQTRRINERDVVVLDKKDSDWTVNRILKDQEIDKSKVTELLTSLDELKIVGVRPKPDGLSAKLTKSNEGLSINQNDMMSLQGKGFYFTRDGSLRSNEGELQAKTDDGVSYTLRFGEVVFGSGLSVSAGTGQSEQKGTGENRYLFITTDFNEKLFAEPGKPADTGFMDKPDSLLTERDRENQKLQETHLEWQKKIEKGRGESDKLNARFAKWYYVISSESFDKLNLSRKDFVKKKEKK